LFCCLICFFSRFFLNQSPGGGLVLPCLVLAIGAANVPHWGGGLCSMRWPISSKYGDGLCCRGASARVQHASTQHAASALFYKTFSHARAQQPPPPSPTAPDGPPRGAFELKSEVVLAS
jgi:hypothetical protein